MDEKEKQIADGDRIIIGSFQFTMQLTTNRQLVLAGQFYNTDSVDEKHARLDEYQTLIDRQFIQADLLNKKAQREAVMQGLEQHIRKLEELQAIQAARANGDKKAPGLNSQQMQILKQGQDQVRGAKDNIAMLDSLIAAAQKKLQLGASPA